VKRKTKKLVIACSFCGRVLKEPGGLIFSPPKSPGVLGTCSVRKYHICQKCWSTRLGLPTCLLFGRRSMSQRVACRESNRSQSWPSSRG
jgi:hypothetical protein